MPPSLGEYLSFICLPAHARYWEWEEYGYAFNPLVYSAQMFEDFIGKVARLSRRNDARLVMQRTIESYLIIVKEEWQKPYR